MRERPWFVAFAALVVVDLLWIAPRLLVADLNLDYPFTDSDSWDWIANALALAGHPVRFSGRPPLVPLVLAGLERLGAMRLFPLLVQVLVHGTALVFFRVAASRSGPAIAFATGAALLLNHSYQGLALDLMADVTASCLLFGAVAAFLAAEEQPRWYVASGLLGALSALAQQAALLLPLAAATVLLHRRRDLRSPWLWAGAILFAAPPLAWMVWQRLALGSSGGHWRLLRLHDGASVEYYLWALASLLGLPGLLLWTTGLLRTWAPGLRRGPSAGGHLFVAAVATLLLLFFTFAYDFHAKRFLAYGYWVGGLLIAAALAGLPRPALRGAAALLVACSLLPLPAPGRDPSWVALWPLPPVLAHVDLVPAPAGSADLDLDSVALAGLPFADLARASNLRRVLEAGRQPSAPRLDPAAVAGARGALFVHRPAEEAARYRTTTQLGNALRRTLGFVPANWLAPYLELVSLEPAGRLGEAAVFRAEVRGLAGTWLLLATSGAPGAAQLAAPRPAPATRAGDRDLRRRMERGRRRARAIATWIADSDAYVAMLPGSEDDLARLYLPFLVDPAELRIVEPAGESGARAFLAGCPVRAERRFGPLLVRQVEVFGRRSAVILPAG